MRSGAGRLGGGPCVTRLDDVTSGVTMSRRRRATSTRPLLPPPPPHRHAAPSRHAQQRRGILSQQVLKIADPRWARAGLSTDRPRRLIVHSAHVARLPCLCRKCRAPLARPQCQGPPAARVVGGGRRRRWWQRRRRRTADGGRQRRRRRWWRVNDRWFP